MPSWLFLPCRFPSQLRRCSSADDDLHFRRVILVLNGNEEMDGWMDRWMGGWVALYDYLICTRCWKLLQVEKVKGIKKGVYSCAHVAAKKFFPTSKNRKIWWHCRKSSLIRKGENNSKSLKGSGCRENGRKVTFAMNYCFDG